MNGDILNLRPALPNVLTAGQPTVEQLHEVATSGVRCVINLALPTSTGALPDERATVTALGMEYVHIPVVFENPTVADYLRFEDEMDRRRGQSLLVHCAMNYRASAFMAVYRVRRSGLSREQALRDMRSVWEPDAVWSELLAALLQPPGTPISS